MVKGKWQKAKNFNIEHSTSNFQLRSLHFEADYLIVKERGEKNHGLHIWLNLRAPFEKRP
jgi:hypothetical protein